MRATLTIGIADTGPGIPAPFRPRIFDKFFRLEDHQAEGRAGARGAGIGLYMCRQIVELHGGEIACGSGLDDQRNLHLRHTARPARVPVTVMDAVYHNR